LSQAKGAGVIKGQRKSSRFYSVADPVANPAMHGSPSSLDIDFGTLQRRNKREILGKY